MDKQNSKNNSTNKIQGNGTSKVGSQFNQKKNNGNAQDANNMNDYSDSINGKQSGKN